MAKKKLTPEEKAMNKFKKEWSPENLSPSAFKQLVEQLAIKNTDIDVKPAIDASQLVTEFKDSDKKEEQRSETLVDSQKKLIDNLNSLNKTLAKLLPTISDGKKEEPETGLDYRPLGQQFKEKIFGRPEEGGKFDTNSLRWKLGSVRGLALSSGLVKPGGIIDNATAVREERLMKQAGITRYKEDEDEETQDDKLNVSEEEQDTLKALSSGADATHELIAITKVENERKAKADADLLAAIQNMQAASGGGGVVPSVIEAAGEIAGAKILSKAGGATRVGKLAKLGKFATRNSKALKIGGGVLAGGIAAYEGYSDYKAADEQVKSGVISEDEGDVKKTGAVTGAAGGLGGALAGAAIGQAVIPIPLVGALIGGAVGGIAGSKLGKGIGEWGAETWKGMTGNDNKTESVQQEDMVESKGGAVTDTEAMKSKYYKPASKSQVSKDIAIDKAKMMIYRDRQNAEEVAAQSADNAMAKTPTNAAASNTIVNAPTNVSRQTQNTSMKVNVKDQDNTLRSYYRSRFAS